MFYNPDPDDAVIIKNAVLALAMKDYFTSFNSLMILEAPPNLSIHQSI